MKKREPQSNNFEASLAALETIVRELEEGDLPLEESLQLFEKGVKLSRECQERLNEADRRINLLLRDKDGHPLVTDFEDEVEENIDEEDDDEVF
jgi:exodeoxyribonuclease VII small subunit